MPRSPFCGRCASRNTSTLTRSWIFSSADFATVAELRDIGVRRISVGGALARTAWTGFLDAAREIAEDGTFKAFGRAVPGVEINKRFA